MTNPESPRVAEREPAIYVVAGNGTTGYDSDYGPAVCAPLNNPRKVAVDSVGNLYIADYSNHRVRKVDAATGQITTVAGNGTAGFNGDNQPAVNAQLNGPRGLAVDSSGNLYIVDNSNHRVRRVDAATRQITTVAGNGTAGFNGDNQPAVNARLYNPHTVAVDSGGNLFIADTFNHRVRKVEAATRQITTVAGNGTAGFNGDGGPAIDVRLNNPVGVAVDSGGSLFLSDYSNQRVRKVSGVAATVQFSVAPGGPPDVRLERAGNTGYPGVQLRAEEDGTVPAQSVRVDLPAGAGLQFVAEPRYQLTVLAAGGTSRAYYGTVSADGQSLTFDNVDLALSGRGSVSAAWVAVKALAGARLGDTRLTFRVGARTSDSTTIRVEDPTAR
ncbi:hypothetical protein ACGFNV_33925 [Streptomyces sp. NPDC048751]|uniref:hypothetical protein n=1 Tax=Streptomyces sp. NPDC048751 TaxID=3365591 RepID=UPI003720CB2E